MVKKEKEPEILKYDVKPNQKSDTCAPAINSIPNRPFGASSNMVFSKNKMYKEPSKEEIEELEIETKKPIIGKPRQ